MRYEKGHGKIPGCGRPKGTLGGRNKAIGLLDTILAKSKNLKTLKKALQAEFDKDPIRFFEKFAIDLAPKKSPALADESGWADMSPGDVAREMMKKTIGDIPGETKDAG